MSRLLQARTGVRPALKGRLMLAGPSGSGKSRSALIVATVLAEGGSILVIDTEKESALTYADDFTFEHLPWSPPFDPRELAETLKDASNSFDVIIVDSLTHFWRADGGTLDIANGTFTGWKEARPAQDDLVQAVLGIDSHVIITVRSKMKYEQFQEGGKHKVAKLGMASVQDDDLEYEMNVSLTMDMGHTISVAKSRTVALPVGRDFKPGHSEDLAVLYRDWLKGGEPPAARAVVDDLVARMNALPEDARKGAKQEFIAHLGRPDHLRYSQVDDAEALVSSWEATVEIEAEPVEA